MYPFEERPPDFRDIFIGRTQDVPNRTYKPYHLSYFMFTIKNCDKALRKTICIGNTILTSLG